jgi:GT2 family glycosyltransferase
MSKTAVVILNWNGKHFLGRFLPGVAEHSLSDETDVVVADNGSGDGSLEWVEKNQPRVKIIRLDRNYGFAEGYNRALSLLDHDFFVLLNSDVEVTPGWLEPLLKVMDEKPEVAACAPKLLDQKLRDKFEYAGAGGGYLDKFAYPFCRGRIFNVEEKDCGQYDDARPVFWGTGACLLVRADVYKETGGLDPDFFAHMEEIDLCWRLRNRGHEVYYQPDSVVYHVGAGTLKKTNPKKTFLNFRNNLYLIYKNMPRRHFRRTIFLRMLLDYLAAGKFLFGMEFSLFWAVLKAHKHFLLNLRVLGKKRKQNAEKAVVSSYHEIMDKSIVYQFFIKGKKRFSDIEF